MNVIGKVLSVVGGVIGATSTVAGFTYTAQNPDLVKDYVKGNETYSSQQMIEIKKDHQKEMDKLITENTKEVIRLNSLIIANNTRISELETFNNAKDTEIQSLNASIEQNNITISNLQKENLEQNNQITALQEDNATKISQIEFLNSTIEINNSRIAELEQSQEAKTEEIENLQAANTAKLEEIEVLTNSVNANNIQISELESNISSLNVTITQLTNENNEQKTTISNLESEILENETIISNLQGQVIAYETLLQKYVVVTYVVDGVENLVIQDKGSLIDFNEPTKEGYSFNGWSLSENGEPVASDYIVQDGDILYAVFKQEPVIISLIIPESDAKKSNGLGMGYNAWITSAVSVTGSGENLKYVATMGGRDYTFSKNEGFYGIKIKRFKVKSATSGVEREFIADDNPDLSFSTHIFIPFSQGSTSSSSWMSNIESDFPCFFVNMDFLSSMYENHFVMNVQYYESGWDNCDTSLYLTELDIELLTYEQCQ